MRPKILLELCFLALVWGSSYLLIKLGLRGLSPIQIVLGRLTGGAAVLVVVNAARRISLPRDLRVWGHFVVVGLVGNILPYFLFAFGETHVASSLAGVLNATTPLWTLAIAMLALADERPSVRRVVALVVGFTGVVVLVAPWRSAAGHASLVGELACLGAGLSYGFCFVYIRRFLVGRGIPATALAAGQITMATVMLWLLAPVVARTPMHLTAVVVLAVLALGVSNTGLANILNYHIVGQAGATTASLVTYLIPVVAVTLGVAFLHEPLHWNLFAGAVTVLVAVALAQARRSRPEARHLPGT